MVQEQLIFVHTMALCLVEELKQKIGCLEQQLASYKSQTQTQTLSRSQSQSQSQQDSSTESTQTITIIPQKQAEIQAAIGMTIPRPISTGIIPFRTVLTYYTKNTWTKSGSNNPLPSMDWNGILRMYLSPMNVGYPKVNSDFPLNSYETEWIRIKILSITFFKSMNTQNISGPVNVDAITNMNPQQVYAPQIDRNFDGFTGFDGATYTLGYFSAQELAGNKQNQIKDMGDSFIVTKGPTDTNATNSYFYGQGITTERVPNSSLETIQSYQYDGKYACEGLETKTVSLGESCEILITNPKSLSLGLTSTIPVGPSGPVGQAQNTYSYGINTQGINTKEALTSFWDNQYQGSGTIPTTPDQIMGSQTPIYGMVQIDLPEDLIQTIYGKNSVSYDFGLAIDDMLLNDDGTNPPTADQYTKIMRTALQDQTLFMLNANFHMLIEYGLRERT